MDESQQHPTSGTKQSWVTSLPAVAATVVLALAACGTTTTSSAPSLRSTTNAAASCQSAYVDWLDLSGGVTCDEANDVAATIFMGDDGEERTSFLNEDFSPLPTIKVAGVGYLPTHILGAWRCGYSTRRSSYGAQTGSMSSDVKGPRRLVYATCRLTAGIVRMTTAMDRRVDSRDS